jgi:hypothetical protein
MAIEIDVFFHTDQTRNLQQMDMDFHITDCEIRKATFIQIVGFSPVKEKDGYEYANIHTATGDFATPLSYEELKKIFK